MSVDSVRRKYAEIVKDGNITTDELVDFLNQSDSWNASPKVFGSFVDKDEFAVAVGLLRSLENKEFTCDKGVLGQLAGFVERGADDTGWEYWLKGIATSTVGGATTLGGVGFFVADFLGLAIGGAVGGGLGLLGAPIYIALDD